MELKLFLEEINLKYNYDFRNYSSHSMRRRILHGMNLMGCHTIEELHEKVLQDSEQFQELMQYITVPVSSMFRDPSYYLALRKKVIPHLKTYPSLKIWIAGCSTGEEVYSIAILLQEEGLLDNTILYATDINKRGLEKAEKGVFSQEDAKKAEVNYQSSGGKRLLKDYYTTIKDKVKFDSILIKNVIFSGHSLVTDSVFSETHLISCRNVLIYFDKELQDRALELFHESLCRKGFLGLGSKETLQFSNQAKNFDAFSAADRIYQKK